MKTIGRAFLMLLNALRGGLLPMVFYIHLQHGKAPPERDPEALGFGRG